MPERIASPKRRPLFDIVNDLLGQIAAADGCVTDAIDALELELNDKCEAYIATIRQLNAEADALHTLVADYKAKAAKRGAAAVALQDRLRMALERAGVDRISTATARAYFANTSVVKIEDNWLDVADERFIRRTVEPDLLKIKRALQDGLDIAGARLETVRYLRIG